MRQEEIIEALIVQLGEPTLRGMRGSSRGDVPTANWGDCNRGPAVVVDYGDDDIAAVTIVYREAMRESRLIAAESVDDIVGRVIRDEMPRNSIVLPLATIVEVAAAAMGVRRLTLAEATMRFRRVLGAPTKVDDDDEVTWRSPHYSQHIVSLTQSVFGVTCTLRDYGRARVHRISESTDDPSDVEIRTARSARSDSGRCSLAVAIEAAVDSMACGLLPG
jgi:hypothetical protein